MGAHHGSSQCKKLTWTLPSGSLSWILTAPTHDSLKISDDYSVLDGWIEKNAVDAADQASFRKLLAPSHGRRYIVLDELRGTCWYLLMQLTKQVSKRNRDDILINTPIYLEKGGETDENVSRKGHST